MSRSIPLKVLRHNARRKVVQALYQWDLNRMPLNELVAQFLTYGTSDAQHNQAKDSMGVVDPMRSVDKDYFKRLITTVLEDLVGADQLYKPYLDRPIEALNPVERAILRMSSVELKTEFETPMQVVVNEAVELAKAFGATDGFKYVNAVIDSVAKDLRALESAARVKGKKPRPPSE